MSVAKKKQPAELRSARWFAPDDLRAFGHRSRAMQMGYAPEDWVGRPVIAILNTWSEAQPCHMHFKSRVDDVKRGILQAGGFPMELPALSLSESFLKPTTMLYRNLLAMDAEEHGAIGWIRTQRFLCLHRKQVAIEHRRRLHERLAQRHERDFHREATSLPDAAFHFVGPEAEMRMTGVCVAPRVQDGDDRFAAHLLWRETSLLRARAMTGRAKIVAAKPAVAAQVGGCFARSAHASRSRRRLATGARRRSWSSFNGDTYGGIGPADATPDNSVA